MITTISLIFFYWNSKVTAAQILDFIFKNSILRESILWSPFEEKH